MQDSIQLGGSNFLIRIRFRQNASWQGTIHWLDGKESKNFRSMLEMVTLIQEALDRQEKGSQNLRSWSSKNSRLKAIESGDMMIKLQRSPAPYSPRRARRK